LNLHGEDGIGGVALPDPVRPPEERNAVEWLADLLMEQPLGAVEVLALGPLTNLARLVLDHPEAARRISRIIAMGGAIHEHGNVGPRSEFNLWADPEAAAVVFASGLPLVLIPLDVTRRVRADREFVALLAASEMPMAVMVANLIKSYFEAATNRESRPLHDPCVILFALSPELFHCEHLELSVSTARNEQAGELAIAAGSASVRVAMRVNAPAVLELLERRLTAGQAIGEIKI
jgi:purine nucleosidase/pyrimidine-specific ribonucleoside hydrolase